MYRSARFAFRAFERARQLAIKLHLAGPLRKYLAPLAGRLVYRLSVQGSGILIVHGHKMLLASRGYPPLQMVSGAWERDTVRLFERILKTGDVVVDIGAHVGYFTLIAARSVGPEGRVYAFEPDPENYALLVRNIELNGYQNIIPIQKAVWNITGKLPLFSTGLDSGQHSLCRAGKYERASQFVETITLDTFLEEEGLPKIDLIKMDIEGAEPVALEGMQRLLRRGDNLKLIVEFCPVLLKRAGLDPADFLFRLSSLGFRIFICDKENIEPLKSTDVSHMIDHLYQGGWYKNLLCLRKESAILSMQEACVGTE